MPPASKGSYKSSFFDDFKNLNAVMWHSNNALVADPDKKDAITSTPTQWPMLSVGLRMCGWEPDNVKFYLLGNPVVWWPSFISLFVFIGTILVQMVRQKRNVKSMSLGNYKKCVFVYLFIF